MIFYELIDFDIEDSTAYYFFSLSNAERFQKNNPRYVIYERETEDEPE